MSAEQKIRVKVTVINDTTERSYKLESGVVLPSADRSSVDMSRFVDFRVEKMWKQILPWLKGVVMKAVGAEKLEWRDWREDEELEYDDEV